MYTSIECTQVDEQLDLSQCRLISMWADWTQPADNDRGAGVAGSGD